jgi:hypothetical protein
MWIYSSQLSVVFSSGLDHKKLLHTTALCGLEVKEREWYGHGVQNERQEPRATKKLG